MHKSCENTKRLIRGTITNCGCENKNTAKNGPKAENLTNQRFGDLLVVERATNNNGRVCWLCRCSCGQYKIVAAHNLKAGKVKSCGCKRHKGRFKDITGQKYGHLTALYPTDKRDRNKSVYWHCKCDCGNEADVTLDSLNTGNTLSCGCLKEKNQEQVRGLLHFVNDTCVELLEKRKYRKDNTSGFRGVYPTKNGKYAAYIGFRRKQIYLGTYSAFEEAVQARLEAEKEIHGGFLETYYEWKEKADQDPKWAEENPIRFSVEKTDGGFVITK